MPSLTWCGINLFAELAEAAAADGFTLKNGDILDAVAEDAGRGVLSQHDISAIHKDLHGFLIADIHTMAQLGGQNDTSQVIDAADDASRFHMRPLPVLVYWKQYSTEAAVCKQIRML